MKLKFLIISTILVSFFCFHSIASGPRSLGDFRFHKSFLLISKLGNDKLPPKNSVAMKSPTKAALFSIVVPGTGELYTESKRGYIHMAAEVGLFAAYIFLHRDAEELRDDCKEKIRNNVEFTDKKDYFDKWGWEDYEHATMFNHWNHDYYTEENFSRYGPFYWPGYEDALKEEKKTYDEIRQEALDLREKSNDRFQLARGFILGLIVNHLISAIDARILAKNYNQNANKKFPVTFKIDLSPKFVCGKLLFEKKF